MKKSLPDVKNPAERKINGFTLIELLMVVLIIGILAAIALPHYERAVQKTRFMQIVSAAKNIYDAQIRYYMANGSYADSFFDLDIEMQGTSVTDTYVRWENLHCHLVGERLDCGGGNIAFTYTIFYSSGSTWCCASSTDNYAADWLCKSVMGGEMFTGHTPHCWKR